MDTENQIEIPIHPLLLSPVVENVFRCLQLNDLKSSRLVCKTWNEESLLAIRRSCGFIKFTKVSSNVPTPYFPPHKVKDLDRLGDFIECVKNSDRFPFGKLGLGISALQRISESPILQDFFEVLGPWITELDIVFDNFVPNVKLLDFLSEKRAETFPLLKQFAMVFVTYKPVSDEDVDTIFTFVTKVMRNCPALQIIQYTIEREGNEMITTSFFDSISEAIKNAKIFALEITGWLAGSHLEQLSRLSLKLQRLKLELFFGIGVEKGGANVGGGNIDQAVSEFLETQSGTLKDLSIYARYGSFGKAEFPRMGKLKRLKVDQVCRNWENPSKGTIVYRLTFPRLTSVSFVGSWDNHYSIEDQPAVTVEELKLGEMGWDDFEEDSAVVALIFPNIKKLELPGFGNWTPAQVMLEKMSKVEEITIEGRGYDIEDLLKEESDEEWEEEECMDDENEEKNDGAMETEENVQVLRNGVGEGGMGKQSLPKLNPCFQGVKTLRLTSPSSKPFPLSDESCRLLMQIETLKCIDFCGKPKPSSITDNVWKDINKRFLVYVTDS